MSVFATPDGRPFLAGTYFPDRARHGMPAFRQVLEAVIEAWDSSRRDELAEQGRSSADVVANRLATAARARPASRWPAGRTCCRGRRRSGWRRSSTTETAASAPLRSSPSLCCSTSCCGSTSGTAMGSSLEIVERTLEAMASGGIYDQLGGGFARYSVDRHWDVPHFEKMLYDQALHRPRLPARLAGEP